MSEQPKAQTRAVKVEVDLEVLARLIRAGHMCVADLHCLDGESKQAVWQLCLTQCARVCGDESPQINDKPKVNGTIPSRWLS